MIFLIITIKGQYCPEQGNPVRFFGHQGLGKNCLHVQRQTVNLLCEEMNCSGTIFEGVHSVGKCSLVLVKKRKKKKKRV